VMNQRTEEQREAESSGGCSERDHGLEPFWFCYSLQDLFSFGKGLLSEVLSKRDE
jgi:hypothetical protein